MAVTNLAEQEKRRKEEEERQKRRYERSEGKNNNEAKAITRTYKKQDPDAPTNNGGFWGGVGYLGEKLAAGTVQSIEGMVDYIVGGVQKAIGDATGNIDMQDAAYDTFNTQWWNGDFYRHADEWYNPSGEMKVAGDVAGGIGTSLPAIGTAAAITALSHGAAAPWAVGLASAGVAGLGAAGNATSEAVQQTGSLDWSKIGYGSLVGATEAGVEYLTAGIGTGTGRIIKNIAQSSVGKAASQLTKRGLFNIAKEIGKDFASEAAEEAIAEIMAPVYARMTYNPDAQFATPEQVWYAAFVGGMSGILMGGAGDVINTGKSRVIGGNIAKNQVEVDKVLRSARQIAEFYEQSGVESETMKSISAKLKSLEASMAKSGNAVGNALRSEHQKKLLGDLAQLNTAAAFETYAAQRAYDIVQNIDAFVEKASAYKYTDPDGNPITVSKEALLKGVKLDKNGNINRKSLIKAIRENRDLQYFALMDVAGRMQMDTAAFTEASKQGVTGANDLDLARYLEQASDTEKASLARALGVQDLETLSADEFNSRVAFYNKNSAISKELNNIAQIADSVKDVDTEGAIPSRFRRRNDGTYLYESDGNKIAIVKQGDSYAIYDYKTGRTASRLTKSELDRMLKDYNERHGRRDSADATTETKTATKTETAEAKNAEVEAFAAERVKGYSKLLPAEKTLVRRVIRQGWTLGVRDDILSAYANVCAHAKILVQFRKGVGMEVKTASGEVVKSNGYYDDKRNVIVANPDATNGIDHVLIHELDHAIRSGEPKRGKAGKAKTFSEAIKGVAEDVKANIKATYGKDVEAIKDETNAYYAETVLSAEATVERLVADRPSLKDKILGFFSKAKADYKDVPFLDKAAESYYQKYKKMFDKFAKRNAGGLVSAVSERNVRAIKTQEETPDATSTDVRYSIKYPSFSEADISSNMDTIADMEAVATVDASKLEKTGKKPFDLFLEYFDALGNNIASSTFGDIALNRASVKSEIRHGITAEKVASLEAIPSVIEQGKVIFSKKKPGTDVDRIVIAAPIKIGNADYYMGVMLQRDTQNQRLYLHNVVAIKAEEATTLSQDDSLTNWSDESDSRLFITIILQKALNVKAEKQKTAKKPPEKRFSLPLTDSEGKKLSAEQREFFSQSKQVDAEGRLQVMYQGAAEEFYSFDKKRSRASNLYGRGFYFTNSADQARNYGNVRPYYLNITTPLSTTERTISRLQMRKFLKAVAENEDYSIENYGTYDVEEVLKSVYGKDDFAMLYDVSLTAVGDLVEAVELFNEVNGTKYDGFILDTESVIFKSEQAKLTSNKAPTLNKDIRYSLPLSSHAKAAVETFGTTSDVTKAGFVLPDGRMLNFERNGGVRHDRIAEVYDGVKGDAAVNAFIQEGNVRIKATAPGIEISSEHMPTVPQRNALNRFISRMLREKGRFYVDITDVNGRDVNTFEYDSESTAEDVMWDLRGYYGAESTEAPAGVKNSLPLTETDRAYMDAVEKGDMETAQKMVYEAAEKAMPNSLVRDKSGDLLLVYHGSASKFTKFLHSKMNLHGNSHGRGFYFTENKDLAESYAKEYGQLLGGFLNIESTLSEEKVTIKKPDLVKLIKETCQQQAKSLVEEDGYDNLREALRDTWVSNYVNTYSMDINSAYREVANIIYSNADSDVDIVAELTNAGAGNEATLTLVRKLFGKDGVIYKNDLGTHEFVALTSNQFKSADPVTYANDGSIIPLSQRFNKNDPDIRYSLPLGTKAGATFDPDAAIARGGKRVKKVNMTVAQLSKVIANNTKKKVYSKKEALRLINNLSASDLVTAKTRNELATEVWALLNQAPDPDYREQSIRQVAEFIAAKFMTEAKYDNRDPAAVEEASYVSSNLHTYVGRIDFGSFAEEIKAMVGEDGWKAIRARWSFKKRNKVSTPMDVMMWDVVSEVKGFEGLAEMHPAEAFVEIDKRYTAALSALKKDDITLWETMDDAKARAVVDGIARDIRDAFMSGGNKSKLANILDNNIGYYKARIEEMVKEKTYKTETDKVKKLAERLKKVEMGALDNATQASNHNLKAPMKALADEMLKTEFSPEEVRAALTEFGYWYRSDETKRILGFKSYEDPGLYSPHIVDLFDFVLRSLPRETAEIRDTTPLSINDVKAIQTIMSHAIAISENYQKVWKNGKLVDALPEAEKYIETMQKTLSVKVNAAWERVYGNYLWQFGTPADVMAHADKFMEGGFFSEMFQSLRDAAENAAIEEMNVLKEHDAFLDEHKHYVRESTDTKVKFRGQEIPKQTLITLYMTSKREHAWAGLVFNGAQYKIGNLEVKVNPLTMADELTYEEMKAEIASAQSQMEALLSETDKEYIAILEKGYNLTLKEIKIKRDMERMGFTNAMDGYYIPIKRANMATTIDQQFLPINTASNSSFNKNTVQGAAQALELVAAEDLFLRHAHEVCQYAHLSPAIESFDVLWNIDTAGNRNNPTSLKTVYHAANPDVVADRKSEMREKAKRGDMEGYLRELIQDIQGTKRGDSNEWISAIRGGYATFQLGANPKVWLTQLSSIFASLSEVDAQSVFGIGGINFFSGAGSDVDLYCPLAELRNYNNDAASAQAVMDMRTNRASEGLQKVRDLSMAMIGKMDRLVVMKVFIACKKHVAKHQGLEYGTEANKIAAGKLLKTVIENTQQGSLATEKSKAARGSEIMKTFTMFRSDAIKVMGRVLTSAGNLAVKMQVAKSMKANPGAYTAEQIAKAEADVKAAGKKLGKSMAALVSVSAFMTFVSWLFRHLYNKDEDKPEDELIKTAITFGGSLFGGLPIISDIYSSIVEGFAIENFALGAANDLVEAIKGVGTLIVNSAQGKASSQDWMRGTRDIVYAVCSIMGLPVRNLWNAVSGVIRRFFSGAGKAIDNVFYPTYADEFGKALEAGDEGKAHMIMQILAGERLDGADSAVIDGFNSLNKILHKKGKDIILPANCPASVTIDGKKFEFTPHQQNAIQDKFAAKAEKDFKRLFASDAYKGMTALQKKAAVKAINDMRMHEAMEDVTNKSIGDTNVYLAQVVSASVYAQYKGVIYGIESDKDKNGKTISGSKRKKVIAAINRLSISKEQKLVLILAAGYTIQSGDIIGVSAGAGKKKALSQIVNCTSLSEAERVALADKLGFEVVNGKIKG